MIFSYKIVNVHREKSLPQKSLFVNLRDRTIKDKIMSEPVGGPPPPQPQEPEQPKTKSASDLQMTMAALQKRF